MDQWELTRLGQGFEDRHPLKRDALLAKVRDRIAPLDEPITFHGDASSTRYNLEGAMTFVRNHLAALKPGDRLVFKGDSYDQPRWVIRGIEVKPPAPMCDWLEQFVGKSPYLLGGEGPPGQSDCSAATRNAAKAVHGIALPHSANLQMHDLHLNIFRDTSRIDPDDFIFYNYGRLDPWDPTPDVADHVELIARPGPLGELRCIGSRPSTHGVSFYTAEVWDRDNILAYGRLEK